MLGFGMGMHQELRTVAVTGGLTATIFPAVDALLEETEYQKALGFVSARKDMGRYRSMVDFLFSEIFIRYRPGCFAYYRDEEKYPMLKDILKEEERVRYERWLVEALKLAHQRMDEARKLSWTAYRAQVLAIAA